MTVFIFILKFDISFTFLIKFGFSIYYKIRLFLFKEDKYKKALIIIKKSIDLGNIITLNNFIKIYNFFAEVGTIFFILKTIIILKNQLEILSTLTTFFKYK